MRIADEVSHAGGLGGALSGVPLGEGQAGDRRHGAISELTVEGRGWMAKLYAHVFASEHDRRRMGPHLGAGVP
jgi:hypothetical protein